MQATPDLVSPPKLRVHTCVVQQPTPRHHKDNLGWASGVNAVGVAGGQHICQNPAGVTLNS